MRSRKTLRFSLFSLFVTLSLLVTPLAGTLPALAQGPGSGSAPTAISTLVDVQPSGPEETLDPHWMYDTEAHRVAAQVYETLLIHEREDPAAWRPLLATGWQVLDAGQTYRFSIRSGVSFHGGGTLQAHDVAYSFWRAMLQDRENGPAWLLLDPLLGVSRIDELAGDDAAKCQAVKDAVTYDDAAASVTFHLPRPFGPFLEVLGTSVGLVLDQEWMAAQGDWGGECADWRDYHDPHSADTALNDQMNGTGPFRFVHWTPQEIRLERFEGYWRPAWWTGGPGGPAALDAVVIQYINDWPTRRDMLLAGTADLASVPGANGNELAAAVWGDYDGYQDTTPSLVDPVSGTLRLYRNLPQTAQTPFLFNFQINADTNPYIGSGALDGNGIPPDFFTDLHVRKGLNYAMDWPAVIAAAYGGQGSRSRGPIPAGVLGYSDTQAVYEHDATLAAQELQLAWGGQLWAKGFHLVLSYDTGNVTRQLMSETLAQNLEALNAKFDVSVVAEPYATYLSARNSRRLPLAHAGWMEDYHHPHNWVHPFLHSLGGWGGFQRIPAALVAPFDDKIEECLQVADPGAAQTCYEQLQNMSYTQAMGMWGLQPVGRAYVRTEVRGWYSNPALSFPYYYALSKGAPPTVKNVTPTQAVQVRFDFPSGSSIRLSIPAGAVTEPTSLIFTPDYFSGGNRSGGLTGLTFFLRACPNGECPDEIAFAQPVPLRVRYRDADVLGVIEDQLYLYTWDGATWVDVAADCGWGSDAYQRDLVANQLTVSLCHASAFALVGATHNVYLPLLLRNE